MSKRFRVYRTQSMEVVLTPSDLEEQLRYGETSEASVVMIAESSPASAWNTEEIEVLEA